MSHFNAAERAALLSVKGVGATVIARLEEIGLSSFGALAVQDRDGVCAMVSAHLGSTCWKNSPQARAAIAAAIACAKEYQGRTDQII